MRRRKRWETSKMKITRTKWYFIHLKNCFLYFFPFLLLNMVLKKLLISVDKFVCFFFAACKFSTFFFLIFMLLSFLSCFFFSLSSVHSQSSQQRNERRERERVEKIKSIILLMPFCIFIITHFALLLIYFNIESFCSTAFIFVYAVVIAKRAM